MKNFNNLLAFSIFALTLGGVQGASAASSNWQDIDGGKARIVALASPDDGTVSGAVELQLDKGWKTYWRTPGDSGIPPRFDFSQSKGINVSGISWPTPFRIDINGDIISGYTHYVAFPFRAAKPVDPAGELSLSLLMGICKSICIPVNARLNLPLEALNASNFKDQGVLEKARQNLPKINDETVRVETMTLDGANLISAKIAFPDADIPADDIQLFVEDENKSWFEPAKAVTLDKNNGMAIAAFEIPFRLANKNMKIQDAPLTLTLRAGQNSFEFSHRIK